VQDRRYRRPFQPLVGASSPGGYTTKTLTPGGYGGQRAADPQTNPTTVVSNRRATLSSGYISVIEGLHLTGGDMTGWGWPGNRLTVEGVYIISATLACRTPGI
jgi:hypothetical protein